MDKLFRLVTGGKQAINNISNFASQVKADGIGQAVTGIISKQMQKKILIGLIPVFVVALILIAPVLIFPNSFSAINLLTQLDQAFADEGNTNANSCVTGNTQASELNVGSLQEFLEKVGPLAQADYNNTGVFASVTLGQWIGESGFPLSQLATKDNNLFGIKCNGYPTCTSWSTGEYYDGAYTTVNDSFRHYNSIEESINDHSKFLMENERYVTAGVFDAKTYQEQITAIHNAGYATSPTYASNIIQIIQENNLDKWDVKGSGQICGDDYNYNGQVTDMMKKVVDMAKARAGSGYDNGCEAWVEQVVTAAIGTSVLYDANSAYDAWIAHGVSEDKSNIPPGAAVYGSGSAYPGFNGANPYGHVGIYVGDGKVADQGGVTDLESWLGWQVAPCNGHTGWFGWGWTGGIDLTK